MFEGSEKKLEILSHSVDLREWGRENAEVLVEKSGARILSKVASQECDAYLLSESSLFLWKDRLTMITCGQTSLVHAAEFAVDEIGESNIDCLFFQRKNEYFPHMQKTDFHDDLEIIRHKISGEAYRFGNPDDHHLFLFHSSKPYQPDANDNTLEILMYDLRGRAEEAFCTGPKTRDEIRELTGLHNLLPGAEVDDFVFDPQGYSLNAVLNDLYYTIHVTPQEEGPYVSFETNMDISDDAYPIMEKVIDVFCPQSFDAIAFRSAENKTDAEMPNYQTKTFTSMELTCGYHVKFAHFFKPEVVSRKPFRIL